LTLAARPKVLPNCGLCNRRFWTVEDDGGRVWCRRWTLAEVREHWADEDRVRREQVFARRVDETLIALGIGPPAPKPRPYSGDSLIDRLKAIYRIEDILFKLGCHLPTGARRGTVPCPLHGERTGRAFSFDIDRQRWRCWGKCGTHGDVVDLIRIAKDKGLMIL
jgi:hypothetical protein